MKVLTLLFTILLCSFQDISAQNRLFRTYRSHCSKSFGIELNKLKDFKVIDGMTIFKVNEKLDTGMFYQLVLESKSKDCLILYPHFDTLPSNKLAARHMAYGEAAAALNLFHNPNRRIRLVNSKFLFPGTLESDFYEGMAKLDTTKYVSVISQNDMTDYSNADTVFIFKVRLPQPYEGIYNECIGINMIKEGCPSAMIKILLTEEGKKKEEEYMQAIFKNIRYPVIVSKYNQQNGQTH